MAARHAFSVTFCTPYMHKCTAAPADPQIALTCRVNLSTVAANARAPQLFPACAMITAFTIVRWVGGCRHQITTYLLISEHQLLTAGNNNMFRVLEGIYGRIKFRDLRTGRPHCKMPGAAAQNSHHLRLEAGNNRADVLAPGFCRLLRCCCCSCEECTCSSCCGPC